MGRDPDNPDYPSSHECFWFDDIFHQPLPDSITCSISGVEKCPGAPAWAFNGVYTCVNDELNPCNFEFFDDDKTVLVSFAAGVNVTLRERTGSFRWAFLGGDNAGSRFPNLLTCGSVGLGYDGQATISWGPPPL